MMANDDLHDDVSFRGGSRVAWVNTSFPFAKLVATRGSLKLSTLGTYEFTPEQVVSFGTYGSIPLLANGLAIEHNRLDYPARMVFWCVGSRERVLEEIRRVGFVPRGIAVERASGMPFRWSFAIAAVLAWNALFLVDSHGFPLQLPKSGPPFGPGTVAALALAFLLATGIKASTRLQRLALAPGHVLGEVRGMLTLLQLVSCPMALGFGAAWFFGR
jgi:hypothetical protein